MIALKTQQNAETFSENRSKNQRLAGVFYTFAGSSFILLITFLESIYPSYSVHSNTISDLLAIGKPTAIIGEPIAFIVAVTWIAGGFFLFRGTGKRSQQILNVLPGTGLLLAVLSPENVNIAIHSIGAVLGLVVGSVAVILSYRGISTPFRYFSLVLGLLSLSTAVLEFGAYYSPLVQQILGPGGTERLILYPIIVWLIGYGNYLMTKAEKVRD